MQFAKRQNKIKAQMEAEGQPLMSQAMYNLYESIVPGYSQELAKEKKAYESMVVLTAKNECNSELKTTIKALRELKDQNQQFQKNIQAMRDLTDHSNANIGSINDFKTLDEYKESRIEQN